MTKAETQGVTFPLPAQYRQQDYDLANVTPDQVRSILRNVRNGRLEDQDRLFRLMLDTWPRLRKNLGEVAGAVSRLPLEIIAPIAEGQDEATPKASAIADVVRRAFNSYAPKAGAWELSGPDSMKAGIAAYLKGTVVLEIVWQIANGIASPRCYSPVPAKYLSFPQQGNEVDRLMVAPQGVPTSTLEDFPPDRFLVFVWSNFDAHPIHAALLRPLAKEWLAYIYGKGWAMQYAQLFGIPWRTIKTDGSDEANAEADAFLANIGSSGWARHTTSTEFQIHDGVKGDAAQLPQMVIAHEADRQCDILLLGQTLTTDVGDSGSRALGDVHMAVRADVLQAVASWVAGVITDQLIPAIVRFNFGSVPTEEMPYCEIKVPEARDEKAIAERVKLLKEIGLDIPKKWAHETLGVPIPEPGDELLESKPEETPPPPLNVPPQDDEGDQEDDDEEGLRPTDEMAIAASKALEMRRLAPPGQRTMGGLGMARARDIANGVPLSVETVRSMVAYFDKVEAVRASWPEGAKEWQAWNGYGGDAGAKWARETLERIQ
jgi:phage gp29-like protein